jgi:hypothetical protein
VPFPIAAPITVAGAIALVVAVALTVEVTLFAGAAVPARGCGFFGMTFVSPNRIWNLPFIKTIKDTKVDKEKG